MRQHITAVFLIVAMAATVNAHAQGRSDDHRHWTRSTPPP
jgi:hypothetical protein